MLPAGSLKYTGVVLNSLSQPDGVVPFNGEVPVPSISSTEPVTVSIPGGLDGATILLENRSKNVAQYNSTLDRRTVSEQVGDYGTLTYQTGGNQSIITVVLPPDIAQFITGNTTIKQAASVLEALLTRVDQWSKEGFLVCSRVLRAITRLIAGFRLSEMSSSVQTVELHIYLAHLKRVFSSASAFFGSRANEATGTSSPLILDGSKKVIDAILKADGNGHTIDPNTGNLLIGDSVYIPASNFINELLVSVTRGVLVAD